MEWRDEGLVIGVRRHGEHSSIVEAMTRAHGRHLGLVRGGRSTRLNAPLQPGNTLGLVWRARLDEHLGAFAIEPLSLRAGRLMESALALAGIAYLGALARLLPERDPHEAVYETLTLIVDRLDDEALAAMLDEARRYELDVLVEVHTEAELRRATAAGASLLGINNRNLHTFETDLAVTEELLPLVGPDAVVISESGVKSQDDVRRLVARGARGVLVGESLMRSEDKGEAIRSLKGAAVPA